MFLFLSLLPECMDILEGLREKPLETVMPRGLSRSNKPQKVCHQAQLKAV